jgi:hypothetical protein
MNPLAAGWRDEFGNTLGMLVRSAVDGIIHSEQNREPYRYDPDLFPSIAIAEAVRQLEESRGQKLKRPPIPATPEDLVWQELPLLIEIFEPSTHPIARANAQGSKQRIQAIESCYPGTLARVEASRPGTLAAAGLLRKAAAA